LLAALGAGGAACGPAPARAAPRAAIRPVEYFILEQAALRRAHDDEDVLRFYATLEARSAGDDRRLYAYLRSRLDPDRASRRAVLEGLLAGPPPYAEAALALGDMAFEEGDRRRALAYWDRGDPLSARILARRAYVLGDRDLARRAVLVDGRTPASVPDGFLAAARFALDDAAAGEAVLARARALGLEDAACGLVSGLAALARGDDVAASRDFEHAIALGSPRIVPLGAYIRATIGRLARAIEEAPLEAEELAVIAAGRFPEVGAFQHAAALCAFRRGDEAAALARARRAAADPGAGAAARLLRLLLVRAGRPEEAYEAWLRTVPARRLFDPSNEIAPRLEALRRAVAAAAERPADAGARLALGRACAAVGWTEEAVALGAGGPGDRDEATVRRVRLGQAVREALRGRAGRATAARALAAVREAALAAGMAPDAARIEVHGDEAGTLATPDAPLARALLDAGLVLDVRPGPAGPIARVVAALSLRRLEVEGGRPVKELIVEGAGPEVVAPSGILGRTSPDGGAFFADLDAIRPSAGEVAEIAAALEDAARGRAPPPLPPEPAGALAASPALHREIVRRAAAHLGDRGDDSFRLARALTEARIRYVTLHERGHATDLARLVPLSEHPIANLGRVLDGALAPADIAARYEEIAELYALARDSVPYVPLLSIERALPESEGGGPSGAPDLPAPARRAAVAVFAALRDEARALIGDPQAPLGRAIAALDGPMIRRIAWRRLAALGLSIEAPP
jgi:hypothetical protein